MKTWPDKKYLRCYDPTHANSYSNGTLYHHVWVMSNHLGRPLRKGEEVHHKNGVKTDNRIENLELWCVSQPSGQRPADLVNWARQIKEMYPELWLQSQAPAIEKTK